MSGSLTWDRLCHMCLEIGELSPADRREAISKLEESDPRLAAEVQSLLAMESPALDDPVNGADVDDGRPAPASILPPIHQIGRYAVDRVLGHGASATVYAARRAHLPRPVAIKLFHAAVGDGDPDQARVAARRFEAEVRALSALRHPGIVAIIDAASSRIEAVERRWIAMDLVDGLPITSFAEQAGLDRTARVRLVADLAAAVAHAHGRGVIHRDLKPANVLVERRDKHPVVRVLDFGVARLLEEDDDAETRMTRGGQVIGTDGYFAPEQLLGDPNAVTTSVDVYAVGLLLQELLAGRPAIDRPTGPLVMRLRALAESRPRSIRTEVPGIDEDLAVIVETSTARAPDDRYASVAALEQDLRSWLGGEPIGARPLSSLQLARRFLARNRLAAGLVAAALAAVVGIAALTIERQRAQNAMLSGAIVGLLELANRDADALDRQYGSTTLLDESYRRSLAYVASLVPAVGDGAVMDDPLVLRVLEQYEVPDWSITGRGDRRIARYDPEVPAGRVIRADAALRESYGDALIRFSAVLVSGGDLEGAMAHRLIGLALESEALARRPRDRETRRQYAHATVLLGDTLVGLGDRDIGVALYERALAVDRELAAEFPEVVRHLDDVAWGLERIATQRQEDEPLVARALHHERLGICLGLRARLPRGERAWGHAVHGCALSANALAKLAVRLDDEDPESWFKAAERDFHDLAVAFPQDIVFPPRATELMWMRAQRLHERRAPAEEILACSEDLRTFGDGLIVRAGQRREVIVEFVRTRVRAAQASILGGAWERVVEDLGRIDEQSRILEVERDEIVRVLFFCGRILETAVAEAAVLEPARMRVASAPLGRLVVGIERRLRSIDPAGESRGKLVTQLRQLLDSAAVVLEPIGTE